MNNSALRRRQELLEQGRQMSGRQVEMPGRNEGEMYQPTPARWKLRLFLAALLFAGFVFMDQSKMKLFQVDSKVLETSISQNIDTESVMKFIDKAKNLF